MAKYILLWEVDSTRTPEDGKTKKAQWLGFQDMVARHLKEGLMKAWGGFVGEMKGFAIFEGSATDLHTITATWTPFVKFNVREILSVEEVNKATKALPE